MKRKALRLKAPLSKTCADRCQRSCEDNEALINVKKETTIAGKTDTLLLARSLNCLHTDWRDKKVTMSISIFTMKDIIWYGGGPYNYE